MPGKRSIGFKAQTTFSLNQFVWFQKALAVHVSIGDQIEDVLKGDATLKIATLHLEHDAFEEKVLLVWVDLESAIQKPKIDLKLELVDFVLTIFVHKVPGFL